VAIDLDVQGGDDAVRYEAARVVNPDRIFFDLHHAKVSPQLAGKSFSVTDDGFLTRVRAAQFSEDVTRVVLDVHAVAEYSAFLLPNPTRLIIDIHGKTAGREVAQAGDAGLSAASALRSDSGRDDRVGVGTRVERSVWRMSAWWMVTWGALRKRKVSSRARAGSNSMQWRRAQRFSACWPAPASRSVMAPWPGPISMTVRVVVSPRDWAMRRMASSSVRKFWPSLGFFIKARIRG
jgi:hypothetical protein